MGDGAAALRDDLSGGGLRTLQVDVAECHGGALAGEKPRRRGPDPARRAGDERDPSFELSHQAMRYPPSTCSM
jgi:hypothetical protein